MLWLSSQTVDKQRLWTQSIVLFIHSILCCFNKTKLSDLQISVTILRSYIKIVVQTVKMHTQKYVWILINNYDNKQNRRHPYTSQGSTYCFFKVLNASLKQQILAGFFFFEYFTTRNLVSSLLLWKENLSRILTGGGGR